MNNYGCTIVGKKKNFGLEMLQNVKKQKPNKLQVFFTV